MGLLFQLSPFKSHLTGSIKILIAASLNLIKYLPELQLCSVIIRKLICE